MIPARALLVAVLFFQTLPASAATQSFNNARFAQPGFLPFSASPSAVAALGEILSVPQGDLQVPAPEAELAAVAEHFGQYAQRLADAVLSPAEGAAVLPREFGLPEGGVELAQRLEDLEALAKLLPDAAPQRARFLEAVAELGRRQGPQASHAPPMPSLLADLEAAGSRLGTYLGHESEVHSVALAPDGRSVAAAGMTSEFSGVAILWDTKTGARRSEIRDEDMLTSVSFSPDNASVFTGAWMGGIRSWEAATGGLRREFDSLTKRALTVSVSPDGKLLAAGLGTFSRVWNAVTGELLHTFASSDHTRVAFSPGGTQFFSGGDQGNNVTHKLWDALGGQLVREFTTGSGEHAGVYAATFDPAGKRLLTGAYDGAIVWDADTGAQTHRLAHGQQVKSVAFSPDGRKALTADAEKIHLWDADTWRELRVFRVNGAVLLSVVFRADGAYAFTQTPDHAIHLWKIPTE